MDGGFPPDAGEPFGGDPRERFRGTAENAKTKMCLRWEAGNCRFGERCNFAHGEHELRRLPPRVGGVGGGPVPGRGYGRGDGPPGGGAPYYGGAPGGYGGQPGRGGSQFGGGYERPQFAGAYGGAPAYGGSIGGGMGGGMAMGGYGGGMTPQQGGGYGMQQQPQQQHGGGGEQQGWGASAQGFPVQGTGDWTQYTAEDGQKYYHNHISGETVWDMPGGWQPMH